MLTRAQSGADILIGRVQAAHDLDDDADGRIARDVGNIRHRKSAQLWPGTAHQHLGDGEVRPLRAEVQNAAAYHTAAQQSNVHRITSSGSVFSAPIL